MSINRLQRTVMNRVPKVKLGRPAAEPGRWALKNMRNDHLRVLAIGDVQLTEDANKKSLLFARSPDETRYHAGQDDEEGRPAAKCDGLANCQN